MKKIYRLLALLLSCSLILCACAEDKKNVSVKEISAKDISAKDIVDINDNGEIGNTNNDTLDSLMVTESDNNYTQDINDDEVNVEFEQEDYEKMYDFSGLDDQELQRYLEDVIYQEVVETLDSDDYFVQDVSAVYISNEYIEELAYNSQQNIFFGYNIDEIEENFQGTRFVFTLSDDGETVVKEFESYDDTNDIYMQALKNVAIGTGVIVICVTVAVVTVEAAPAISVIMFASAKTGTIMALQSGAMGAVSAGIMTGIQTGDVEAALQEAALQGSSQFMFGAIAGSVAGGISKYKELDSLTTLTDISLNDVAKIQRESKYPVEVIKQFHSYEEYKVFTDAGLTPHIVNKQTTLVRKIDLDYVNAENGLSNRALMKQGKAPFDPVSGKRYELHHIGQRERGTLAILTEQEHDSPLLHGFVDDSEINRTAFKSTREKIWKEMAEDLEKKRIE